MTDWNALPEERRVERAEEERERAQREPLKKRSIDPNTASRDELMRLPGIGEKKALAIIEEREVKLFSQAGDLARVPGIGEKIVSSIAPYLTVPSRKER